VSSPRAGAGKVFIYGRKTSTDWDENAVATLFADPQEIDPYMYGRKISMATGGGNTFLGVTTNGGSAFVYRFDPANPGTPYGSQWLEFFPMRDYDGYVQGFGSSISLSGNQVIIGAVAANKACIFQHTEFAPTPPPTTASPTTTSPTNEPSKAPQSLAPTTSAPVAGPAPPAKRLRRLFELDNTTCPVCRCAAAVAVTEVETKDDDDAAQELNELSDPESGSFIALMIATAVAVVLLLVCIGGIAIAGIGFAKRKEKLKHDEDEIVMHELDVSEMNLSFQPRRLTIPRGVSMDADMLAAMAIVNGDMEAGKTTRKNPLRCTPGLSLSVAASHAAGGHDTTRKANPMMKYRDDAGPHLLYEQEEGGTKTLGIFMRGSNPLHQTCVHSVWCFAHSRLSCSSLTNISRTRSLTLFSLSLFSPLHPRRLSHTVMC